MAGGHIQGLRGPRWSCALSGRRLCMLQRLGWADSPEAAATLRGVAVMPQAAAVGRPACQAPADEP